MKDRYPIGTLVRHRHFITRKLGVVTEHAYTLKMVVRWFHSPQATYEEMWEIISIEEIDND